MNQFGKTSIFIVVAAVVVLAVYFTRPAASKRDAEDVVGDKLIAEFEPVSVADMEIVDFNEATGKVQPFEVKRTEQKGKTLWTIPSHSNYPADAKDQVAQAATSLLGLAILGAAGDSREDREEFGVVDFKDMKDGSKGVGMKVTLRDKNGKDLVSLIVGKEVPKQKGQRYVRIAGQNPVYIVEMKTDYLSAKFDRWIEKSLLQISPWDISKLWIRDHAVETTLEGNQLAQHGEIVLQYNDQGKPQWELLDNLVLNDKEKLESVKLADDQELNTAKLDEMKNALPELQIVDVVRKPEIFSADLKIKGDKSNLSKYQDILEEYGFHWANVGDGFELYSNNGEVRCLMNNGVEYILRFGDIAYESAATGSKDEKAKDKQGPGMNRFLFVMAQFNPAGIPLPEQLPLPGDPPPASEAKPADNPPPVDTNSAPIETKPAGENAAPPSEEKKPVEAKPTSYNQQNPAEEKPADAKPADAAPVPDAPADTKPAEVPVPPAAGPSEENPIALPIDPKALEAAREKVEKENRRKKDEYEEKVKAGKKRVEELNARFADWFYIISDETYQKIHLSRENLIVKKGEKKPAKPGEEGDLPPGMDMPQGFPMPVGK